MNTYISGNEHHSIATASTAEVAPTAGRYLIFYLGCEEYGIQASRIREIISPISLQLVPGLPYCAKGVFYILGKIIPVIDLRLKLGLAGPVPGPRRQKKDPDATWTAEEGPGDRPTCGLYTADEHIVVLEAKSGSGSTQAADHMPWEFDFIGIVVDYVSEIADFRSEDIEPSISAVRLPSSDYVLGQVQTGRGIRTLLDIDLALNLEYVPDEAVSRSL